MISQEIYQYMSIHNYNQYKLMYGKRIKSKRALCFIIKLNTLNIRLQVIIDTIVQTSYSSDGLCLYLSMRSLSLVNYWKWRAQPSCIILWHRLLQPRPPAYQCLYFIYTIMLSTDFKTKKLLVFSIEQKSVENMDL